MLEGCHAVEVGQVDIGTSFYEQVDDLLVTLAAIAKNDGFEESGPAEAVDVIDVDARFYEGTDGFDVAALGGGDEGGAAVAVDALEVGAVGQGEFQDFEVTAGTGIELGAVLDAVLGVDVGRSGDERLGGFDVVGMCRDQKGGFAFFVARLDVVSGCQQSGDGCGVVGLGGVVQWEFRHGLRYRQLGRGGKCEGNDPRQNGAAKHCALHCADDGAEVPKSPSEILVVQQRQATVVVTAGEFAEIGLVIEQG